MLALALSSLTDGLHLKASFEVSFPREFTLTSRQSQVWVFSLSVFVTPVSFHVILFKNFIAENFKHIQKEKMG